MNLENTYINHNAYNELIIEYIAQFLDGPKAKNILQYNSSSRTNVISSSDLACVYQKKITCTNHTRQRKNYGVQSLRGRI